MKMKKQMVKMAGSKIVFVLCMLTLGFLFHGCSPEPESINFGYDTETVTRNFEQIFCRNGKLMGIIQNQYDPTTRTVGVEDAVMPCRIFAKLTGMEVGASAVYGENFRSYDKKCSIAIAGILHPVDGVYATLSVQIPGYPQVKWIRLVDAELLNDKNEVVTDATTGEQDK